MSHYQRIACLSTESVDTLQSRSGWDAILALKNNMLFDLKSPTFWRLDRP